MRVAWSMMLAVAIPCGGQAIPTQQTPGATYTVVQNLPQLEIGKNDLLDITVYDSPELSGTFRVGPDGTITLPMLGEQKPMRASGMLPAQLAAAIAKDLEGAQLVVHAEVTVKVAEYQSRTVTVVGAVRHPISFQAYGRVTLLDAIGRADGLADTAGRRDHREQRLRRRVDSPGCAREGKQPDVGQERGG